MKMSLIMSHFSVRLLGGQRQKKKHFTTPGIPGEMRMRCACIFARRKRCNSARPSLRWAQHRQGLTMQQPLQQPMSELWQHPCGILACDSCHEADGPHHDIEVSEGTCDLSHTYAAHADSVQ